MLECNTLLLTMKNMKSMKTFKNESTQNGIAKKGTTVCRISRSAVSFHLTR